MTKESTQLNAFTLDWLVSNLRWLWLFLAAVFVIVTNSLGPGPALSFSVPLILILVGLLFNGIYAGLLWAKFFPTPLAITAAVFDAFLAVGLLLTLDEYALQLLPIMLFPVILAGMRWNSEAGILMALPIVLAYALPLIPMFRAGAERPALISALLSFSGAAVTLFIAGAAPGPFVHRWKQMAGQANEAELERLRIANERAKLISAMALTLGSTLNYRKVLRAMIDLAFSAMAEIGTKDESAIGMVLLFEGEEGDGRLTVATGRNMARSDDGRKVNSEEGLIGRTIRIAEAAITHNVQRDKVLTSFASTPGCRSAICAPLRAGLNTYGVVLFCSTQPEFYNEEHKTLLTTFCSQAIIALQNAQLFEDLEREQQRILDKEAEARRKLARDLHDGPTQSIAAIAMRLNFLRMVIQNKEWVKAYDEAGKIEEIAQRTTQEIRTMLFALRPVILETQGLLPALNQYVDRLRTTEKFSVSLTARGYDGQLSSEAEGVVFAIIEEAVGNAKKHSQATEIRIMLLARPDSLVVEIKDNGVGFDVKAVQSSYDQRTSLGLMNMDERAQLVGGYCSLESSPGRGTTVRVEVPFTPVLEDVA